MIPTVADYLHGQSSRKVASITAPAILKHRKWDVSLRYTPLRDRVRIVYRDQATGRESTIGELTGATARFSDVLARLAWEVRWGSLAGFQCDVARDACLAVGCEVMGELVDRSGGMMRAYRARAGVVTGEGMGR